MQRRPRDHDAKPSSRVVGDQTNARKRTAAEVQAAPQQHGRAPQSAAGPLTYYPAYTFKASPTWWKWVKLTCYDIHTALKPHEKYANVTTFQGTAQDEKSTNTSGRKDLPLLLFYLNHPIQFVQVIGVVVALDEYFDKFWLFTVDDSSGATIDITCPKPVKEKEIPGDTVPTTRHSAGSLKNGSSAVNLKTKLMTQDLDKDEAVTPEHFLQTTLSTLTIGTVLQAKGTLTTFRSTRQLSLLRLTILPTTTHEVALISSRTEFQISTLSKPWVLPRSSQAELRAEAQGEKDEGIERASKRRKRAQQKREREERHRKAIEREYAEEEEERQREADEARKRGQQLAEKIKKQKGLQGEAQREEVWITIE